MGQQAKGIACRVCSIPGRYRYLFLLATVCGGAFLLLSSSRSPSRATTFFLHQDSDDDSFTIKTEGCTIPALHPFDETIKKFVHPPKSLKQCPNSNYSLLDNNDTHIWIQTENLPYFHVPHDANISCCYKSFYRPLTIADITAADVDDRVMYEPCFNFFSYIEVMNEFVKVTCDYERKTIYEQYFLFALMKPLPTFRDEAVAHSNQSGYNVIVVGIDAISRLNFYRTMPKTLTYLKNKGAIELLGYNKVGDNTFPNVVPMLLGIKEEELKTICWPNMRSRFDNCPFIWEWFKEVGYYSAFGEDSASLGTFNFEKYGFTDTPTDYYIHTFMNEAEKNIGNTKDFNSFICMGNKYFYQVLLDYVKSLTSILKTSKLFGFFWEVTMSHDYLNYPKAMDENFENFLKTLEESDYLRDTILILLSDHGIRWGDIRLTKQGRLEERLPLVHILLPPSFRDTYALAYDNLRANGRRLTTPFDIHATLSDLVHMQTIRNERLKIRTEDKTYAQKRGISLFLPIPRNRTCETAGIEDHWCTCHRSRKLPTHSKEALAAGEHVLQHLNLWLEEQPQCAKLGLAAVVDVHEMLAGEPGKSEVGWQEYMVVVRATPGDGVFEATVRQDARGWTLAGSVSRLNLYGDQSRCVHHYQLKLYCFCH